MDFSENEELWKETKRTSGLGQSILEEGRQEGWEEGIKRGIKALILDNQEEEIPKSRIIEKLQKLFGLPQEKAEQYYKMFAEEA